MEIVVEYDAEEFKKVSNTQKDEVFITMERDVENYETKAKLCIDANDGIIENYRKCSQQ